MSSSNANVKGARKVVVCHYTSESVFKLPDGLDLEDKTLIRNWGVKWGVLYVNYLSGEKMIYSSEYDDHDAHKYGDESIEDADDYNVEYTDDEEDEEVKEDGGVLDQAELVPTVTSL